MKRQQETYLTKFLNSIPTLFLCQKHTAVGLTWQNHLLQGHRCNCLKEAELGRCILCWKHTNTREMECPYFSLYCRLSIWTDLSQKCYMCKMVQSVRAKYNCLKQTNVCNFMLKYCWFQLGLGSWHLQKRWKHSEQEHWNECLSTWWTVKSSPTKSKCAQCHFYLSITIMTIILD